MSALAPNRIARLRLDRWAIALVLVAIYLVGLVLSPSAFGNPVYLLNTVRQVTPVGIAAIGVTMVMIIGGVDLSVGAVISMTVVLSAALMDGAASNMPLAIAVACCAGILMGAINGALIAFSRVSPFILTLGTGIALIGLTQMFTGGTARGAVAPGFREVFNARLGGTLPVLALFLLGLTAVGLVIEKRTLLGRHLFLLGSNAQAARLAGLPVRGITIAAYTLSGLFAALAGLALLARSGVSSTQAGQGMEFQVLAAVVLGGTTFEGGRGGIIGTVIGVLVLGLAFNLVNVMGLPYHAQLVVMGAIIIAASALYGQLGGAGN
ncbi:ABC transporter permease [Roseovarius aestuarii]|nr:ABC transporter permease [Roseovarius aestuarii]